MRSILFPRPFATLGIRRINANGEMTRRPMAILISLNGRDSARFAFGIGLGGSKAWIRAPPAVDSGDIGES